MTAAPAMLELDSVSRTFGSLRAVDGVSVTVRRGARHALIGPNGAGKSTLFNLVAGSMQTSEGRIRLSGRDITRLPEYRRARLGMARTFQHASVFLRETALENVLIAVARQAGQGWSMLRPALRRSALMAHCTDVLERVQLAEVRHRVAGELSHGERRQLELAMALATEPVLLLLDEPAAGISPAETARLAAIFAALPAEMTVLLIEHDLDLVFDIADTITVLHLGQHLRTGDPATVRAADDVRSAYLGATDVGELFTPAEGTGR